MISHLLTRDAAVTTLFLSARERAMLQQEKLQQLASGERRQASPLDNVIARRYDDARPAGKRDRNDGLEA